MDESERKAVFERIFGLMRGGKSLSQACRIESFARSTFLDAIKKDAELADQYARAREELIEFYASEIMEISDEQPSVIVDQNGVARYDSASVQAMRLRVDSRKWLLSKLSPKRYGDRLQIAGDEESPLKIERITRTILDPKNKPVQ